MMAFPQHHDTGAKTLLNGVILPIRKYFLFRDDRSENSGRDRHGRELRIESANGSQTNAAS
jgi:hypothetical protein